MSMYIETSIRPGQTIDQYRRARYSDMRPSRSKRVVRRAKRIAMQKRDRLD